MGTPIRPGRIGRALKTGLNTAVGWLAVGVLKALRMTKQEINHAIASQTGRKLLHSR